MTLILTGKSKTEQFKGRKWRTLNNLLVWLNDGRLAYIPRNFITDNITFISNDFVDVRGAQFHDVGCKYKQIILVKMSLSDVRKNNYLKPLSSGVWICEDIPIENLQVVDVSFNEINKIFKEVLLAAGVNKLVADLMHKAVYLNISWFWQGKTKIDINKFYNGDW